MPPLTERGIALLSVLWLLLLLSTLALAAGFVARTNAIAVHSNFEDAQAEAAADAALTHTLSLLADDDSARHPPLDGSEQQWSFEGRKFRIKVEEEDGRIDLNTAEDDLVLALLESQGFDSAQAAAHVRDLRSRGPLKAVEELRRIESWKDSRLTGLMDDFTVYSRQAGVSVRAAIPDVLSALVFGREHRLGGHEWPDPSAQSFAVDNRRSAIGELIRVTITEDAAVRSRTCTVWIGRLTGIRARPTMTVYWNRATLSSAE